MLQGVRRRDQIGSVVVTYGVRCRLRIARVGGAEIRSATSWSQAEGVQNVSLEGGAEIRSEASWSLADSPVHHKDLPHNDLPST